MKSITLALACCFLLLDSVETQSRLGLPLVKTTQSAGQSNAPSPDIAEANRLNAESVQLYREKRYDEAITVAERALAIRQRLLGADDMPLGASYYNLANMYLAKGKRDKALSLFEQALVIYEKRLGADAPDTIRIVESCGWLRYLKGDFNKAEQLFRQTLESREKKFGAEHEEVLHSLVDLGYAYLVKDDTRNINETFTRIVTLAEKRPAPLPPYLVALLERYDCWAINPKLNPQVSELHKRINNIIYPSGLSITDVVLNGKAIRKPPPLYPIAAKAGRIQGLVTVKITVNEKGKVIEATPLCGHPLLAEASVEAAKKAEFTPTLVNGEPVKVVGVITYNFTLQ